MVAFCDTALTDTLIIGNPERLRHKLAHASGDLERCLTVFNQKVTNDKNFHDENVFLSALLRPGADRDAAKSLLQNYWQQLAMADCAGDVQFHTWCRCGSVLRRLFFFDWLAALGVWTPSEIAEAGNAFISYGIKHPFMVSVARGRSSNNQIISMSLYNAVAGFLFGYKYAQSATARFLFDYGFGRLPELIGLFASDGYGGEGSTYTSHVNTPLACWIADFFKHITGQDWLDVPFRPNAVTLRSMITCELRLISPGGLLAPWDHYGWQIADNSSALAYLAKTNQDPRFLDLIMSLGLFPHPGNLAWGADDPLWTLVWWPENQISHNNDKLPYSLFGWHLPATGAALDDPARRTRLMQVWDICADGIAGVGRAQVNPNHLMMDHAGEPVFQDGVPVSGEKVFDYTTDQIFSHLSQDAQNRYLRYITSIGAGMNDQQRLGEKLVQGIAPGLVGAANAIVIDEQPWYQPFASCVGRPLHYSNHNDCQRVATDCAEFYRPGYSDIKHMTRFSQWDCQLGLGLVADFCQAEKKHDWTFQIYLRSSTDLDLHARQARVRLTNGKSILLAWDSACQASYQTLPHFPATFIANRNDYIGSIRLELRKAGVESRFLFAIAPDAESLSVDFDRLGEAEVILNKQKIHIDVQKYLNESENNIADPKRDLTHISEMLIERDADYPGLRQCLGLDWSACSGDSASIAQPARWLHHTDPIFAQLTACQPDIGLLHRSLHSGHWPTVMAAAEVTGLLKLSALSDTIRNRLNEEHALPNSELYPEQTPPDGQLHEAKGKRWRLKAILARALGRLYDEKSVPLLGQILSDSRDFYCVYSCVARALGEIGGRDACKAIEPALTESEINTLTRARFTYDHLCGR